MLCHRGPALAALTVSLMVSFIFWKWMGRSISVADAATTHLECASFSVFGQGQSPSNLNYLAPFDLIDQSLDAVGKRFSCVRTYSVSHGQDAVLQLAAKHGVKVSLGIWLQRELDRAGKDANARSIAKGIRLVNAYPDVVSSVFVGNEVLLRKDLDVQRLTDLIQEVRSQVHVPVTYADTWEGWLDHPQLASAVDFITIHILPYWEDLPVPVERAPDHIRQVIALMRQRFPGRELFVGETGWPSEGRARGAAIPGHAAQARFFREAVNTLTEEGVHYSLIEAVDQPWKRDLEGTVGGAWGIWDSNLAPKFSWTGPVTEDARWQIHFAATALLAAVPVLWLLLGLRLRTSRPHWLMIAIAAQAVAIALVQFARHAFVDSLGRLALLLNCCCLVLAVAMSWLVLLHCVPSE